jgi:hypothetical protein
MNETQQNLSLHLVQRTLNDIKCVKQEITLGPELMCFSCSALRKQETKITIYFMLLLLTSTMHK